MKIQELEIDLERQKQEQVNEVSHKNQVIEMAKQENSNLQDQIQNLQNKNTEIQQ